MPRRRAKRTKKHRRPKPEPESRVEVNATGRIRRRLLFVTAAASCSFVIALVAAEAVIRVAGLAPQLPAQYQDFIEDRHLPFRKQPNWTRTGVSASGEFEFEYKTNSQGFRDGEHSVTKPPNVFRILAVGDSFTWGAGAKYEETYLARLEHLLNLRESSTRVEIIKAGIPRFYPTVEKMLLEHWGLKYKPDLVLAALLPNDVTDTALGIDALRPVHKGGYLVSKRSERLGGFGMWCFIPSHVARLALNAYLEATDEPSVKIKPSDLMREDYRRACNELFQAVRDMRRMSAQHGAEFAVIHIPQANLSPNAGTQLRREFEPSGIHYLDVQPALRAARKKSGKGLYWPRDGHCTPKGYAVIADSLFAQLTSRGLVPD